MKRIKYLLYISSMLFIGTACEKYVETEVPDQFEDNNFWTSESNARTYSWGFYDLFTGYGFNNSATTTSGGDFYFTTFSDDQANSSFQNFAVSAPATNSAWSWSYLRKANILLERVDNVPMSDEAKNHWKGVARFARAMDYFQKVQAFGGVPWIDKSLDISETNLLYKPRDSRQLVMDNVLADINYAVDNLRTTDGVNTINKDVALALKARIGLYEGTYRKYHTELNLPDADKFLMAAKEAAEALMTGKYVLNANYQTTYNSMDLTGNREVILFRKYVAGQQTHSVIGFTNSSSQMHGLTKSAVESYVTTDGLPISQSTLYLGDDNIANLRANRDKRLLVTISDFLAYKGSLVGGLSSTTGYRPAKFLQPASSQLAPNNETDAPIFWLAEVLLNYAEAAAELDQLGRYAFSQADLDKSINLLRARAGVAPLRYEGAQSVSASGVIINDTKREADVTPLIWEIRRERRVELMMDGFRYQDLMQWKKGKYLDYAQNPDSFLGAKVPSNGEVLRNAQGYIMPYPGTTTRTFIENKHYLSAIPTGQIALYPAEIQLTMQNPNW